MFQAIQREDVNHALLNPDDAGDGQALERARERVSGVVPSSPARSSLRTPKRNRAGNLGVRGHSLQQPIRRPAGGSPAALVFDPVGQFRESAGESADHAKGEFRAPLRRTIRVVPSI